MKAVVYTLGCKVNSVESRSLISELLNNGIDATDELVWADIYIINTCSVTAEADRKSRQTIGKIEKLNKNAKIYVIGCSSQNDCKPYESYENVVYIGGNAQKLSIIPTILSDITSKNRLFLPDFGTTFEEMAFPQHLKTRDYVKVQDGCNNFCSYCIIPYVRGRERSRQLASIVDEVTAASKVCKEIVLTGINVSSYGKDIGLSLAELFFALKDIPVRKRLSSLECNVINDKLLDAMEVAGFCDHFHLSLQSGCDKILSLMNRKYTSQQYLSKAQLIRKYFPNAGITTDIITGFPGETEEDFLQTVEFVKRVGFSDIHIFPYSIRTGTKAAKMPQVLKSVRKERAVRLSAARDELHKAFLEKQVGKTLSVYIEADGEGYSTNYVRVYTDAPSGEIVDVAVKEIYNKGVR